MPSLMTDDLRMARAEREGWTEIDHARCRRLENALSLFGIDRVELFEGALFAYGTTPREWTDREPLRTDGRTPTLDALARLFQNLRNRQHDWDEP
jgi:hypothetical protein